MAHATLPDFLLNVPSQTHQDSLVDQFTNSESNNYKKKSASFIEVLLGLDYLTETCSAKALKTSEEILTTLKGKVMFTNLVERDFQEPGSCPVVP